MGNVLFNFFKETSGKFPSADKIHPSIRMSKNEPQILQYYLENKISALGMFFLDKLGE